MTMGADVADPADRAALGRRVDAALAAFLADRREMLTTIDPGLAPVAASIESLVLRGGKRLRPAFAYWGYRGAGGPDRDDVVAALACLELVHASALIHDDVLDASDTRRGVPSLHRRLEAMHRRHDWRGDAAGFGRATAILAGDLCLVWSDEMLHASGVAPDMLERVRVDFDLMRSEVTVGQLLDVRAQAAADRTRAAASTVAAYKSAKYTVERPLLIGATLGGAPPDIRSAYAGFGAAVGEAFQLRDDVLGALGDPAATGKPAGDDLREGKLTYLVATAFERAGPAERRVLDADLGDATMDAARLDRLRTIIERVGAVEATERRIDSLMSVGLDALGMVSLANGATEALTALAIAATSRDR
jgi:geranylgeranyl diphosphate synthase type I